MKIAIIGSRGLDIMDLEKFLPKEIFEIVSGGAKGIDLCARNYALMHNIKLTEFLPKHEKFDRSAPLKRNIEIIEYGDLVLAFWDSKSRGTEFVIDSCKKQNIPIKVFLKK